MIIDEIKAQIKEAMLLAAGKNTSTEDFGVFDEIRKVTMKAKGANKRDLLRLVVGQAQQGGDDSDEAIIKIVKKIIKSNNETADAKRKADSERGIRRGCFGTKETEENDILRQFVPVPLTQQEVNKVLRDNRFSPGTAKSKGQAMGMAMKILKGMELDSEIVRRVVDSFGDITLTDMGKKLNGEDPV